MRKLSKDLWSRSCDHSYKECSECAYLRENNVYLKEEGGETKEIGNLIVSRKVGEKIYIGDDILVQIYHIGSAPNSKNNNVTVGISAPKDMSILRDNIKKL